MPDHTPPLTPTVLYVGDKRRAWQNPPIYRLEALYATPTTVACTPVPKAADHSIRMQPGKKIVTKMQTHVYPIRDDATWQRVLDQHAALQQALDDLAAGLRALGSYPRRLEEAGGLKQAPNPLTPTVIRCDDPDTDRDYSFLGYLVPSIQRQTIAKHTPKMLRALSVAASGTYEYSTPQYDHFVCPDDAAWERTLALHQAAEQQKQAWDRLISGEIKPYAWAKPEDFANGETPAQLAIAAEAPAPLARAAPTALAGEILMSQAEARACVDRIKASLESVRSDLLALHDQEGWRALGYDSWRACVTAEFGQSQSYLYRQLAAAELERDLGFAIGETPESHLRPLTQLPTTEARRAALDRADELAGDQPRQARHVEAAVREQQAPAPDPLLAALAAQFDALQRACDPGRLKDRHEAAVFDLAGTLVACEGQGNEPDPSNSGQRIEVLYLRRVRPANRRTRIALARRMPGSGEMIRSADGARYELAAELEARRFADGRVTIEHAPDPAWVQQATRTLLGAAIDQAFAEREPPAPEPEPQPDPDPAPAAGAPAWRETAHRALRRLAYGLSPAQQRDWHPLQENALDLAAAMAVALGQQPITLMRAITQRMEQLTPPPAAPAAALTFLETATDFDRRFLTGVAEQLAACQADPERVTAAELWDLRGDIEGAADALDDASYDRLMHDLTAVEQRFTQDWQGAVGTPSPVP